MSKRRKNPLKRPSRTRRHRESVAAKRRARAFWRMREQYRRETEREFAPPPMPEWMRRGCVAVAGGLVGLAAYLVVKLFV